MVRDLDDLIRKLTDLRDDLRLRARPTGPIPVVLIVEGAYLALDDVWWDAGQTPALATVFPIRPGAVCIGDDPR